MLERRRLLVFGDSHSATFANIENIEVLHVGPATAHNLVNPGTTTQAREKILAALANHPHLETAIILAFGEIDCRMHIVKAASSPDLTILQAVNATLERYFSFVQTTISLGYRVLLYGPAGSGTGWNANFPTVGREQERNYATHLFNLLLAEKCVQSGVAFACIDDLVIDKQSWQTRSEFLSDGCHLNDYPNTASELQSIILWKFLTWLQSSVPPRHEVPLVTAGHGRKDHASDKPFLLTSARHGDPISGLIRFSVPYLFHTDLGRNEGIHIDLLSAYVVDEIIVHNRTDTGFERASHLYLALGLDRNADHTESIETKDDFLLGTTPYVSKRFKPVLARYVFLFSTADTYLHLSGIQIMGHYPAEATAVTGTLDPR